MKLQPGNTVEPQQLWDAVRRNGFTPKQTQVLVRGEVIDSPTPQPKVTGTNQLFELKGNASALDEARRLSGKPVTVEGSLVPNKDLKQLVPIEVRAVRAGI